MRGTAGFISLFFHILEILVIIFLVSYAIVDDQIIHSLRQAQPTYTQPYYAQLKADVRRVCAASYILNTYDDNDKFAEKWRRAVFHYISDQRKLESKGIRAPIYTVLSSKVCY